MTTAYRSTDNVSAIDCPPNDVLRAQPYAPFGAAVWTSSGELAQRGITAIAHAATGTMSPNIVAGGEPSRDSVAGSVRNALALAADHDRARLAIPFLASGIFLDRISPPCSKAELAEVILRAAQDHRGKVQPVIVAYDPADVAQFRVAIDTLDATDVELVQGSITDHDLHKADAIVNAANMELRFGGGLSGMIGQATGQPHRIEAEARRALQAFWQANPQK